jgi:hypothetical protein
MITLRTSPPVASTNEITAGFIIVFSIATASSLSPRSSISGVTRAMPSRVSTPRIVRTGASRPGISSAREHASSANTTVRLG